jgi:hypothetical protein
MKIELTKPENQIIGEAEMVVKIGNGPVQTIRTVTLGVFRLINRFKRVQISLTPEKGFSKWGLENNTYNGIVCIVSRKRKRYSFCKRGLWRAGGKMPKQDHVWVKLGE